MKILNLKYIVIEVESINDNPDLLGWTNHIEQTIKIRRDLSEDRKKVVLLHEVLHCIFQQLGFIDEHDNEQLIESLSTAFYQVLIDNPVTWIS